MTRIVTILAAFILVGSLGASPAAAQTDSWAQTSAGGAGPAPRDFLSFAGNDGQYAYLFGGFDRGYLPPDLWRYDHLTTSWARLAATGPAARKGAGSSFGKGNFVIFGGASGMGVSPYYQDTWLYSEITGKWTNASPRKCTAGKPCPDACFSAAMAYDTARDSHGCLAAPTGMPWY